MDGASNRTLRARKGATHAPLHIEPRGRSRQVRAADARCPAARRAARVLRIIGGTWRGRQLRFTAAADIRPTPDRVRETLFNWLGAIAGARCLDLFAGSGALGLEALSRGAAHVTFVEREAAAAQELGAAHRVAAPNGHVEHAGRARVPRGAAATVDIVFLDPPFAAPTAGPAAQRLAQGELAAPGRLIYVECAARAGLPAPAGRLAALRRSRRARSGIICPTRERRSEAA